MLVILLLGTSGAQIALQEEKASRHERDRLLAFLAAESALKDAEHDISSTTRVALFEKSEHAAGQCEAGLGNPLLGLCQPSAPDMFPVWQKIDLGAERTSVPFGYFTGRTSASKASALPPSYLVEILPATPLPEGRPSTPGKATYRITAIGFGTSEGTQAVLQSYLRKAEDGRWERVGWREIQNWEEMREALEK
ncbi:hypothetical protein AYR66_26210 [Noviherbaspirillum denitrificans]|uniref:Uncharacterized protein n=2 Tax=Noviherbaspirillum denitrificans TaxID=1968433 RepID=A0A254TTM5_9BURK|nr:hypothetical protein AYR66_26210 [Noviherbaspirillum denitrificans]